jgi:hypothetical protein
VEIRQAAALHADPEGEAERGDRRRRLAGKLAREALHRFEDLFFSEQFLESRPLLTAMKQEVGSVLLIDEIDKSDEEFEALSCWKSFQTIRSPCRRSGRLPPMCRRWLF